MTEIDKRGYVDEDVLVSTDWVSKHLNDPLIRIVESNEDQLLYRSGHIPGAVEVDWVNDLNDPVRRDYLDEKEFAGLMSRIGVTPDTTIVFYGDKSNWWACYAFWVFQLFGHEKLKVMDGGRLKWEKEKREMAKETPEYRPTDYPVPERDDSKIRAFRDEVLKHSNAGMPILDVRSPEEFSGKRLHMPDYPNEGALRGGHIPGAKNVPWAKAVNLDDGTFRSASELRQIYEVEQGLNPKNDTIAYCRIGERSSLSWFVLKYLLGFEKVKNYDGSWTEWGNLVNVPVEK